MHTLVKLTLIIIINNMWWVRLREVSQFQVQRYSRPIILVMIPYASKNFSGRVNIYMPSESSDVSLNFFNMNGLVASCIASKAMVNGHEYHVIENFI